MPTTLTVFAADLIGETTIHAFLRRSDTGVLVNAGGDQLVESPSTSGRFQITVAEAIPAVICAVGFYDGAAESAAAALFAGWLASGGTLITADYPQGGGDALQATLLDVQDTVDSISELLVGAESIALTGPVQGSKITVYVDSDYRVRSGTQIPLPVTDPGAVLSTRLNAIGMANLAFGSSRAGKSPGQITGTIASVTAAGGITTITIEMTNCGSSLVPGDYTYQIQASQTHSGQVDNEIVLSGLLVLEHRTVPAK